MKRPRRTGRRVIVAALAAAFAAPAGAASVQWASLGSGNWGSPGNWSTALVPAAADAVTIGLFGVRTVSVTSGTFSAGSVIVTGSNQLSLTGGQLSVGGTYTDSGTGGTVVAGGKLVLGGASSVARFTMSAGELAGSGSLAVTSSAIISGGTMTGGGTATVTGGATLSGTLGLGTGRLLRLFGGASNSGTIDIASGARLEISGSAGASFDGGGLTGSGTFAASETELVFNTGYQIATRAEFGRVQLNGAGDVTFTRPVQLSDHLIVTGVGRGDVRFNGPLVVATTNAFPLRIDDGRTVTIAGGATFSQGRIALNPSNDNRAAAGRLVNAAGSELIFAPAVEAGIFTTNYGNLDNGQSARFVNQGVVTILGAVPTTFDAQVDSTGTVRAIGATLQLARGGTLSGELLAASGGSIGFTGGTFEIGPVRMEGGNFTVAAPAALKFNAGAHTLRDGSLSGTGRVSIQSGALVSFENFSIATPIDLNGGELRTSQTISLTGPLTVNAESSFTGPGVGGSNSIFRIRNGFDAASVAFNVDLGTLLQFEGATKLSNFQLRLNQFDNPGQLAGRVVVATGARLVDNTFGTSAVTAASRSASDDGSSARLFIDGVYEMAGGGTTTFAAPTTLNGRIELNLGRIEVTRDSDLRGVIAIGSNGVLAINGQAGHRLLGASIEGAGRVEIGGRAYLEILAPTTIAARAVLDNVVFGGTSALTFSGPARVDPGGLKLQTPATITFAGGLDVPGSDLFQLFVDNGGELRITGGASFADVAFDLNPAGGGTAAAGRLFNAAGSTIIDNPAANRYSGVFTFNRGGVDDGRSALFTNEGSYIKRGAGETTFAAPFINRGTLSVEQGRLTITDDSTQSGALAVTGTGQLVFASGTHRFIGGADPTDPRSTTNGAIAVNAPASLVFASGRNDLGNGSFSGAGQVALQGGFLAVTGAFTIGTPVLLNGGLIDVAGSLRLTGPVTIGSGGATFTSPGVTRISGDLSVSNIGITTLINIDTGHEVRIEGTASMSQFLINTNPFMTPGQPTGILTVAPGALLQDSTADFSRINTVFFVTVDINGVQTIDDGRSARLNIEGTYRKSGTGLTQWVLPVVVSGTGVVEVAGGSLDIANQSTLSGALRVTGDGVLSFSGGSHRLLGGSSLSGNIASRFSALVLFEAGSHTINAVMTGITGGGRIIVWPGALLNVDNARFDSGLSINLAGGELRNASSVSIEGPVNVTAQSSFTGSGQSVISGALTSTGAQQVNIDFGHTLRIAGTATLADFTFDLNRFDNPGLPAGRLSIEPGAVFTDTGSGAASVISPVKSAQDSGASALFTIGGTYSKTGSGTTTISAPLQASGRIEVGAGRLEVAGPYALGGATISVAAGSVFSLGTAAGFFTTDIANTAISGAGQVQFRNSNINIGSDFTIGTFADSSNVSFRNPYALRFERGLTVLPGAGTWFRLGGTTTIAGPLNVLANGRINIDEGQDVRVVAGGTLNNFVIDLNPAERGATAGKLTNLAGSTLLDVSTGASLFSTFAYATDPGTGARFDNQGVYRKTGDGTTTAVAPVFNSGLIEAQAGRLLLSGGLQGNGTLSISNDALVRIGSASTAGTVMRSNGASRLELAADLTVTGDFVNATHLLPPFSGNAFDKRAGITGAGQLLAGGAPVQTVVGNGVTAGSTTTPTITLGSIRVGTVNQYSFEVANTGTGPALRGALQTAVNGGNLNDPQLEFAAANFGPGTRHTLSFTPSGAGALSIASGQKVAVVSQFDNVATQLLSINVLADAKVYTPAVLQRSLANVDFGIVRVGDSALRSVGTITNAAAVTALNDVLTTSFSGSGAPFAVSPAAALGAGQSAAVTAALGTATAGVFSSNVTAAFSSHNPDMDNLALGTTSFMLGGQVNNLASAAFRLISGPGTLIERTANSFLLDFGDIARGATGLITARIAAWNRAPAGAPSDRLLGKLDTGSGAGGVFAYSGFSGRFDLGTDGSSADLLIDIDTGRIGQFRDSLLLSDLFSSNGVLTDLGLSSVRLDLQLAVSDPRTSVVPLPPAGWLMLGGLFALGAMQRRR